MVSEVCLSVLRLTSLRYIQRPIDSHKIKSRTLASTKAMRALPRPKNAPTTLK